MKTTMNHLSQAQKIRKKIEEDEHFPTSNKNYDVKNLRQNNVEKERTKQHRKAAENEMREMREKWKKITCTDMIY